MIQADQYEYSNYVVEVINFISFITCLIAKKFFSNSFIFLPKLNKAVDLQLKLAYNEEDHSSCHLGIVTVRYEYDDNMMILYLDDQKALADLLKRDDPKILNIFKLVDLLQQARSGIMSTPTLSEITLLDIISSNSKLSITGAYLADEEFQMFINKVLIKSIDVPFKILLLENCLEIKQFFLKFNWANIFQPIQIEVSEPYHVEKSVKRL